MGRLSTSNATIYCIFRKNPGFLSCLVLSKRFPGHIKIFRLGQRDLLVQTDGHTEGKTLCNLRFMICHIFYHICLQFYFIWFRNMSKPLMTGAQFETMRLYLIILSVVYRLAVMPTYLQVHCTIKNFFIHSQKLFFLIFRYM